MKISDYDLINMVYDLIAQNPIAGCYPERQWGNKITHDDLSDYVVDVDSENHTIEFSDGNRTVQLKLVTTHVANPPLKQWYEFGSGGYTTCDEHQATQHAQRHGYLDLDGALDGSWINLIDTPLFIMTHRNYYFQVHDDIDLSKLVNAKTSDSLEAMEAEVMRVCELSHEEVESMALVIRDGSMFDDTFLGSTPIEGSVEDFLNDFQM